MIYFECPILYIIVLYSASVLYNISNYIFSYYTYILNIIVYIVLHRILCYTHIVYYSIMYILYIVQYHAHIIININLKEINIRTSFAEATFFRYSITIRSTSFLMVHDSHDSRAVLLVLRIPP